MNTLLCFLIVALFLLCSLHITLSAIHRGRRRKITSRAHNAVDRVEWFIALALALSLSSNSYAQAPIIRVALTVVPGENALSRSETRTAFRETRRFFAEQVGINLMLVSTKVRRAPGALALFDPTLEDSTPLLYYWSKRFWKKHVGGVINVAVLPPLVDADGIPYFSGRAGGFCSLYSGFAYMTAPRTRLNGQSGVHNAAYTLAHELGHVLGAPHIDTETIMNPYPFPYIDEQGEIPFDIESSRAIRDCLKDWGKL